MCSIVEKIEGLLTPTKTNFFWMMLANGIYALCQWGMLVVLAKLGSPVVVGQFAFAAAVTAPVIMITNMQLLGVQATDTQKEFFLSDYMAVRVLSTVAAFCAVLLVLHWGDYGRTVFWVTVMLALAKSVESLSDVFYGFFQQHEKMELMARSMILKGVLSVAVLWFFFRWSSSLPWALTWLLVAWFLVLVLYDWKMGRHLMLRVEGGSRGSLIRTSVASFTHRRAILGRIIKLAFPLGIVMGIISLNTNIPRYAIEKYLGTRDLGIFAALAYTTVAVNMFIQALGQAVSPKLARCFAERDYLAFKITLKRVILINLVIGLTGVLVIFFGGEWILSFIYTPDYAAYSRVFVVLMVSATLSGVASALGYGMTAARQFVWQVPLFLAVLVTTLSASFLLIPNFKLYGAAMALIFAAIVQIAGGALIVGRAMRRASDG